MNYYICETCGAQYEISIEVPKQCTICSEERQFVSVNGQTWTTLDKMISSQIYKNNINLEEDGLSSITTSPTFGIGQTAYLIQEQGFNLLWDCISYIDQETIDKIEKLGGLMPSHYLILIIIQVKLSGQKLLMHLFIYMRMIKNGLQDQVTRLFFGLVNHLLYRMG